MPACIANFACKLVRVLCRLFVPLLWKMVNIDPEGKYEALEKYGNDLTELARRGKLDPVIGRDDEIRRCIQILSRRTKNNPVIIGEPGVGKTAIAEGYDCCIFSWVF